MGKTIQDITRYIFLDSGPEKADLALVFGTRQPEAVIKTAEIYHSGQAGILLLSGGNNRHTGQNEAYAMAAELMLCGVPREALLLEDASSNTLENILFSVKMVAAQLGWETIRRVLLVTKHYHARRAAMTAKRHWPRSVVLLNAPYGIFGFGKEDWHKHEKGRSLVYGEMEKIKAYLAKGDLEEVDLGSGTTY